MGTAQINGELWGARAREWAELQEGSFRPVYQAAFKAAGVGPGRRRLRRRTVAANCPADGRYG